MCNLLGACFYSQVGEWPLDPRTRMFGSSCAQSIKSVHALHFCRSGPVGNTSVFGLEELRGNLRFLGAPLGMSLWYGGRGLTQLRIAKVNIGYPLRFFLLRGNSVGPFPGLNLLARVRKQAWYLA